MAEWELSKENIQPLETGRNINILETVLKTDFEENVTLQKQQFEAEISSYKGPDPLSVWYNYILWIEQMFPKGGKESGIINLLNKCVKNFECVDQYKNDVRFWNVVKRLARTLNHPDEVYTAFHHRGYFHKLADFYICWSGIAEMNGNFNQALSILDLAVMCDIDNSEMLQKAKNGLNARVVKYIKDNVQDNDTTYENKITGRCVLGTLETIGKKHKAPFDRSALSVISLPEDKPHLKNMKRKGLKILKISPAKCSTQKENVSLQCQTVGKLQETMTEKENLYQPKKWSHVRIHQNLNPKQSVIKRSFQVFVEDS